jgi:hypothetical protein
VGVAHFVVNSPWLGRFAGALLLLGVTSSAGADLAPPPGAKITLELSVDGQSSLSHLRFFVTNCKEPVEESVLEANKPLICNPERGPVRVIGLKEGDLIDLFALIRRDAGRAESAIFLSQKVKTCGEIEERDRNFSQVSQVTLVQARYSIAPHGKDGCKLTRISATTKTKADLQAASNPTPPTPIPPASSVAPPAPTAAQKSDCDCRAAPGGRGDLGLGWLTSMLVLVITRRRAARPRQTL